MIRDNIQDPLFPRVCEKKSDSNVLQKKYYFCYPVLLRCLENLQNKKSIVNILSKLNVDHIGLYAVNEYMDYVLKDERINELNNIYLYDRDSFKFRDGHMGKIVSDYNSLLEDYHHLSKFVIIICNLVHANAISEDLIIRGVNPRDIYIIDELVFGI